MPTTIKVSIAKLGTSLQEVEVDAQSTVMTALRKAGFNLDSVVSVKRNGTVVTLDTTLAHEDVLLVSQELIKWGLEDEQTETPTNIIKVGFTFEKENAPSTNKFVFTDDMSTFEIVKQVMRQHGTSLNDFKELRDENNNVVTFADKLEDNKSYKIIICAHDGCSNCDDED